MYLFDSTPRTLEVVLAGAITTAQLQCVGSYAEITAATAAFSSAAAFAAPTNNTSAVTLISAPAAGKVRQLKMLSVTNTDTVSATVTINLNDNATLRRLVKVTLLTGEELQYTDGTGWVVLDATGAIKGSNLASLLLTGTTVQSITPVTDADAATITIDWTKRTHEITLTASRTIAFTNDSDGENILIIFKSGGTGAWTPVWPATLKWVGGTAPLLTNTVNHWDVVSVFREASGSYLASVAPNYY